MLDPADPTLLLLSEARRRLPHGRCKTQMVDYIEKGSINRLTGKRVYLEYVWLPGGRATSPAAWERFLRAKNSKQPQT